MDPRRQLVDLDRVELNAAAEMRGDAPRQACQLIREPRGEDRPEERDAERAAHAAEERRGRGGDADLLRPRIVLDDEHEHLHDEAQPDADHDHVRGGDPRRRVDAEQREQVHADHEDRRAGDRKRPVAADSADGAPGEDRSDQQPGHERNRAEARTLGAHAVDDLQEERDEDDRAEHRHPDREAHRVRDAEDARAEELERQDRLGRPALLPDEDREQDDSDDAEPDDFARSPRVLGAAPGGEQDQRADTTAEQRGAEVVDAVPPGAACADGDAC